MAPARRLNISPSSAPMSRASSRSRWSRVASVTIAKMLPAAGVTYRAFVDPSGGSEDAMTLAIAHKTTTPDERVIVDAVREVRPPFSPSAVVDDFAVLLEELSRQQGCWRSLRRRVREGAIPQERHQLRSLQPAQVRSVQGHAAVAQRWPHHLASP